MGSPNNPDRGRACLAASLFTNRRVAIEPRTLPVFDNLAKVGFLAIAVYFVIEVWDLNAAGWLASAGVAGIALGFAAKDTLANLFAGVFIIADSPYQVGDYIVLDSGYRGKVLHIGLRSTRMLTRDDVHITIPNSVIGNAALVNETAGAPQYRLKVKVGVAYGSDVDQVRAALFKVAKESKFILQEPEPKVRLRSFGDFALDFELQVWIRNPEVRGRTYDELNTAIYKLFANEGIEIAFPQQDLHLRSIPEDWMQADLGKSAKP
ncbi:MAG: MscS family membrane protein [Candidatus Paceibacteria bacterium]